MKVVVVGGGVVGLASAWSLARRGADVVVVERDRCGKGASWGNAGWVTPGLSAPIPAPGVMRQAVRWMLDPASPLLVRPRADLDFLRWCVRFARSCRPIAHRSGTAATLALARQAPERFDLLRDEGVAFEMHADGLLYLVREEAALEGWLAAYRGLEDLGFDGELVPLDGAGVAALEPAVGKDVAAGLLAGRERHVRPETLTAGLAQDLMRRGARIEEGVAVRRLARNGEAWRVEADAGALQADRVVVAAGVWSGHLLRELGLTIPLEGAKGYSVTADAPAPLPRRPLYLTEAKVGVSPFADRSLRLAGTLELAGLDPAVNPRRTEAVVKAAQRYLRDYSAPAGGRVEWAGLRPLAPDGLPIVGEALPGLFVATGHAMLGVTLAPATGEALAPAVLGEAPAPALAALAPARFGQSRMTNGRGRRQWENDRHESLVSAGR